MKKLLTLLTLSYCMTTNASAAWTLAAIPNKEQPVGYIYYRNAIGTHGNTKSFTSLRFICSLKGGEPIVGLFWDNLNTSNDTLITTYANNTIITQPVFWVNEGNLLFKNMSDAGDLIGAIKAGKIVKFQWTANDTTQYVTAFNTSGADFTDFNTKCKVQL